MGRPMPITYALEPALTAEAFRDLLVASTLAERRPADDLARLDQMLRNADLVLTAREGPRLVGVARSVTDFAYCCYLSDLAVDAAWQRRGIGRRLIEETRARLGEQVTLLLVAAPAAEGYYPKIGMAPVPSCWSFPRAR